VSARLAWLAWLLGGCDARPVSFLDELPNRQLTVIADFSAPAPLPPGIAAFLLFDGVSPCATPAIEAALDGTALARVPAGTGFNGDTCQFAFTLAAAPPPAMADSTVRFFDSRASASLAVSRLLERRALTPTVADGSTVHAGDTVTFTWSTATDRLTGASGDFAGGTTKQPLTARVALASVDVLVPPLPSGRFTLDVTANAQPSIVGCDAAAMCSGQVAGRGSVDVVIP
jgi:hypothetical protein